MTKLLDNLDLIVFAVVLSAVILVLGAGMGIGSELRDEAMDDIGAAEAAVEKSLATRTYADEPLSRELKTLTTERDQVHDSWLVTVDSVALRPELFHHLESLGDLRDGRDLALRFSAPVDLVVDASPGRIRLAWSRAAKDTVVPNHYRVFRKTGSAEEEMIAEVEEASEFEDRDVEPGRVYTYGVQALTDDPAMKSLNSEITEMSKTVSTRAARDFGIEARSFNQEDGSTRFMVKKLVAGVWHEKEFLTAPSAIIGEVDPGSGVDYRTATTYLRIETETEKVPEERDEVLFDDEGRVRLEAGQPISRRAVYERIVETRRAILKNELGEEESILFTKP